MPRRIQPLKPLFYTALPWKVVDRVSYAQWRDTAYRAHVVSSCVQSISYDQDSRTLFVEFLPHGTAPPETYAYYHVPEQVAKDMFHASSMGAFVHRRLTSHFSYQKAILVPTAPRE